MSGDINNFHSQQSGLPGQNLTFYQAFAHNAADNVFSSPGQGTFTAPGLNTFGNVGRNTAFGPHFFNTDLSVQKSFTIHEGTVFQLRADGYNAFNHINFGTPNGNIENGGAIGSGPFPNSSSNPRQLQFSGRLQF
uniref:hypothetical protein n=1 Tax=Granulicella tundricola TaxID=940615 RepID=UPI0006745A5D|nr:hypothetical protein [Granulicella tundricola]